MRPFVHPSSYAASRAQSATPMSWILAVTATFLGACAEREPRAGRDWSTIDDCTSNSTTYVRGGGWRNEPFHDTHWICVVDVDTRRPIADAEVELSDGRGGLTGDNGMVVIADVQGPQTVTVRAPGWATTRLRVPLTSAITVVLEPEQTATAIVEGTIRGWETMAPPPAGRRRVARVRTTATLDPAARADHLPQTANECEWAPATPCAWRLTTRIGAQQQVATIVEIDDVAGTTVVTGYSIGDPLTLARDEHRTDVSLTRVLDAQIAPLVVVFPEQPTSSPYEIGAVPSLDLGDTGRVVFDDPAITPQRSTSRVIDGVHQVTGWMRLAGTSEPYLTRVVHDAAPPVVTMIPEDREVFPVIQSCGAGCWQVVGHTSVVHEVRITRGDQLLWKQVGLSSDDSIVPPADAVAPGAGPLEITARSFFVDDTTALAFELSFDHLFRSEAFGAGVTETFDY